MMIGGGGNGFAGGSGSSTGGGGGKTEWPQSLKNFANRCFSSSTEMNRTLVQEELRALIYKSYTEGTVNTTDWDSMQLRCLGGTENNTIGSVKNPMIGGGGKKGNLGKQNQKKRPALSGNSEVMAEREKNEKRARRFERERKEFDKAEQEGLCAIPPPSAQLTTTNGISLANRLSGSSLNGGGGTVVPLMNINGHRQQNDSISQFNRPFGVSGYASPTSWQGQSGQQLGGMNAALFADSDAADPNVVDWDQDTVVGLSTKLEKPYLRLTSAPDPRNVRTLATLMQTLEFLKKKWRTEGNYNYICDQFKSMRQDLTVQRIKNEFTVKVYEIHARIALEKGDLGEYNQCQSQLRGLYALGIKGSVMEFLAYRILYLLHTRNRRDVNILMTELTPKDKLEKSVKHALKVRLALANGNYNSFFRLYKDSPNMNAYIMDHFIDRERINALLILARCFRPNLSLSFLTSELAFTDLRETDSFLSKYEVAIYTVEEQEKLKTESNGNIIGKKSLKRNSSSSKSTKTIQPKISPLEERKWDAKSSQTILDLARQKFRTVDIKGQI